MEEEERHRKRMEKDIEKNIYGQIEIIDIVIQRKREIEKKSKAGIQREGRR